MNLPQPPLLGRGIVITRPIHEAESLAEPLRRAGATIIYAPTLTLAAVSPDPQQRAIIHQHLFHYDGILFTSKNAVDFWMQEVGHLWQSQYPHCSSPPHVYALGQATAQKLQEYGIHVDVIPPQAQAEVLLQCLLQEGVQGKHFLFPCSREAREELPTGLQQAGAQVTVWPLYRPVPVTIPSEPLLRALQAGEIAVITVASPSAVHSLLGACPILAQEQDRFSVWWAAIGSTTANCLKEYSISRVLVADPPGVEGLVRTICLHFS